MKASQVLLYAGGPFFFWPWKFLVNAAIGAPYGTAYQHFRDGHQDPRNLLLHVGCLILQVVANFCLLRELDMLCGVSSIASTTAAAWSGTILTCNGAPLSSRAMALGFVLFGYFSRSYVSACWHSLLAVSAVCEVTCYHYYRSEVQDYLHVHVPASLHLLVRILAHALLLPAGRLRSSGGSAAVVGFVILLAILSERPFINSRRPPPPAEFVAIALGWLVALITDTPAVFFLCCAHIASSLQGCAHRATAELATLPGLSTHADELGHTTFFPVLLLHAVHDSIVDARGRARSK